MRSVVPSIEERIEALLKEEERVKQIVDGFGFDFQILEKVDEYVMNLGRDFSPYGANNALTDLRKELSNRGYNTQIQFQQDPKDYKLIVKKR